MKGRVPDADREASRDATYFDIAAQAIPADCGLLMPSGKRRVRSHDKRRGRDQACEKSSCFKHVNQVLPNCAGHV
jgi:hypothetical protein